jgi:hypothetical protein
MRALGYMLVLRGWDFGSFFMLHALFALASVISSDVTAAPSSPQQPAASVANVPKVDPFADRPRARIAFAREVNNFQIKRDGHDDILYLETRRDRWFRSEINCFGIADPQHAMGLLPLDHFGGFDSFSRIGLVSFGERTTECRLNSLVELTPAEALALQLTRTRTPRAAKATPAS